MINLNQEKTCLLFKIDLDQNSDHSFDELVELTKTLGLEIIGTCSQKIKSINNSTFIGKGKVEELDEMILEKKPDCIIFDTNLTAIQHRNLERELKVEIIDRTFLILEIFAKHAKTKEGKIQVELAKMMYMQSRLVGYGISLSRLAGGIGTRGPGETKLESDKRKIRERISILKQELEKIEKNRLTKSKQRKKNKIPQIALVGYTNSGKSTLINTLSGSDVYTENKLFATLDPTSKRFILPNGKTTILTDTVGFIRNLPISLIESFKSTFEGIREADLILHVINQADINFSEQCVSVFNVLEELGAEKIPILNVYNKEDISIVDKTFFLTHKKLIPFVNISALKEINIENLKTCIQDILEKSWYKVEIDLNIIDPLKVKELMALGHISKVDKNNENIVEIQVPTEYKTKVHKIIKNK